MFMSEMGHQRKLRHIGTTSALIAIPRVSQKLAVVRHWTELFWSATPSAISSAQLILRWE
jgi:hypothetical protein